MHTPTPFTDHVDNDRRSLFHQLAKATEEVRILIRMAGPDGVGFAHQALRTALDLEAGVDRLRLIK